MELNGSLFQNVQHGLYVVLGVLVLAFLLFYIRRSVILYFRFRAINKKLAVIGSSKKLANPDEIASKVMTGEPVAHLWSEYCETLHPICEHVDGEQRVSDIRATVPAETFFNTQVLVDTPLHTEFFKHLPGIFTGLGIIGTFSGLLRGLHAFSVSEDPTVVRQSLSLLLSGVSEAFIFSAVAIALAMVVTFIEKFALTRRYAEVEQICQGIDRLYQAGVGEEYLQRLVLASETSATQAVQLKDSLVGELKALLTNMVERQIEAAQAGNQALVNGLSTAITEGLKEPLEQISSVVRHASSEQGTAVHGMLENLISAFMAKLEDTFGGQIAGINGVLNETTTAMRDMQRNMAEMLGRIASAGESAGDAMSKQLSEAMASAELRQREMNEQMRTFVQQIRDVVAQSQGDTSAKVTELLGALQGSVSSMVTAITEQQAQIANTSGKHQTELAAQAQGTIQGMGEQVSAMVQQTTDAAASMKESVAALRLVTSQTVDKMNSGAETMYVAASEFAKAGESVTGVLKNANEASGKLVASSRDLENSARTLQSVVSEYEKTKNTLGTILASIQAVAETAKREAGVSTQMIKDMEAAVGKFNQIQVQTDAYLKQVSDVLTSAFEEFTQSLTATLNKSLNEIEGPLSDSVHMLTAVINELAATQGAVVRT